MSKKISDDVEAAFQQYRSVDTFTSVPSKPRCYTTHPVLKMGEGLLLGASAHNPRPGFDVYVTLDGFSPNDKTRFDPWEPNHATLVHFKINDRDAPYNVERFAKMIDWLCNQLHAGKKVHVGCIGGHGRTGTVLAAIASKFGHEDPIKWIRENHCPRAVETEEQIKFLMKHFGAKKAAPNKPAYSNVGGGDLLAPEKVYTVKSSVVEMKPAKPKPTDVRTRKYFEPTASPKSFWRS